VFNAANEVAVARFLKGDISFLAIEEVIAGTLERHEPHTVSSLADIAETDSWARQTAQAVQTSTL
jgi:1-deoxy-D-xylulose-5-phosphate reductoisomerase